MNDNGKKMRPTTIAYIVLFAAAACALGVGITLQLTSVFEAAGIMIRIVTPVLFVAGVVVALIDVRLNPKLTDQQKSNTTKSVFKLFGCGVTAVMLIALIPILLLIGLWILMLFAYGSGL